MESKNSAGGCGSELGAKTKLSEEELVIEGFPKLSAPNGDFNLGVKGEYSVSAASKVLTFASTRSNPQSDRTTMQVINNR